MKFLPHVCLTLVLGSFAGCNQPTDAPVENGAAEPASPSGATGAAAPDANQTSSGAPADRSSEPTTLPTATSPDTGVDSTAPTDATQAIAGDTAADATGDQAAGQAQPPTLEDFGKQLMAALREKDMAKAAEVADAAVVAFPDSIEMQVNRLVLRLRSGTELEATDRAAAAEHFQKTAEYARLLLPNLEQLPEQVRQVIPLTLFNEARGFAQQSKVTETIAALEASLDAGMEQFDRISDDPFFESIRDNDEFKAALEKIQVALRERIVAHAREEIAQQESFPFDFDLPDLDAKPVKLADLKGKLVIVDVWGTWCPPCRMEIPHFVKLQEAYTNDLAIVGLNYENGEGDEVVEGIRAFVKENQVNYTCLIGDDATREQIPDFEGFPTTLFLDRQGRVRLKVVGYHPYEQLEAYVKILLEESPPNATDPNSATDPSTTN